MLNLIIDTVLPGNQSLKLPPASNTKFYEIVRGTNKWQFVDEFVDLVSKITKEKFNSEFSLLSTDDRLKIIESVKRLNVRLFVNFITILFEIYYTDEMVLRVINSGSIPPFPNGSHLESDDWTILEPVFLRGKIYKSINPEN